MRFSLIFGLVFLMFSCGSDSSESKFDLSGTWEYESSITNFYQKVSIKDTGDEVELIYCGFEPENLFKDSNNLFYSYGYPHYFTIESDEKLIASGDLGWNNKRYSFRDLNKVSNKTNFDNGSFSLKSDNLIDKELNFNVCINRSSVAFHTSNSMAPPISGTLIEIVSYESSTISKIRLFSKSIDIGSYNVTNTKTNDEQEIYVEFISSEIEELYGQSVNASSGTVWIDSYRDENISGSGLIELSELYDNRVIEFSFDLKM